MVAIRDQEWIEFALFIFFQRCRTQESPHAEPNPGTLLRVLSPDMFCFVVLFFFFPRFYLINFIIYLFICLSVCLMVAMLMSISTFFE